jgi:GTP-binding protein HflX
LTVLGSLGASDKPQLLVFNKMDALSDEVARRGLELQFPDAVFVSLRQGTGVDELKKRMVAAVKQLHAPRKIRLPLDRGDLVGFLYKNAQVLTEKYTEDSIEIEALIPPAARAAVAAFDTEPST